MSSVVAETYLEFPEQSSNVGTPASGQARLFIKDDESVNVIFDNATVVDLTQAGVTTLSALTDTNISAPADGELLKYVSPPGEWQNSTVDIDDLDNVTITTPSVNQVLQYDGASTWTNQTLSLTTTLGDLTDVNITGAAQGDMLVRGASDWLDLPYNESMYIELEETSTPIVWAGSQSKVLDLSTADTVRESAGSSNLGLSGTTPDVFGIPVAEAMGMLNGYLRIDADSYFQSAQFNVYLKFGGPVTPDAAGGTLIENFQFESAFGGGIEEYLHLSVPILPGSGDLRFWLWIENLTGDPFAITYRFMVNWLEAQVV